MSDFLDKTRDGACLVYNKAKIQAKILARETKVRELYYKLGREYYNDFENNVDDISRLEELCAQIKEELSTIESLKKKSRSPEHMKMCTQCGVVNICENLYCGKCGNKL